MTALHQFLKTAVHAGLCTSTYCTTCGAREFRGGAVLTVSGQRLHEYDLRTAFHMLEALAAIEPTETEAADLAPGACTLLADAARVLGPLSPAAWLGDSWAAGLYHDMAAVAG